MDKPDLTRRRVLSGIAVSGGAGALTGRGTVALFSDEELFTNNSVTTSASTAGVVDLDVAVDSLGDADGLIYTIEVPDLANNNPSYIWVQPVTCPDPIDAADDVDVDLRVECPDSGDTVTIAEGTLREVVDGLRTNAGEPLRCSGETPRCFEPGENVELVLEVLSSDTTEDFAFELEFYAEQCRYNTEATTPFDSLAQCDTGDETTPAKGISWIAFCSESEATLDPDILATSDFDDDDGAPRSLEWETEDEVDYVVAKSGQNFTIYDYSGGSTTTDTVTTGGNDDADFYGSESSNNRSSNPCELAAEKFGSGSFPDNGPSVKLEWDEQTETFSESP